MYVLCVLGVLGVNVLCVCVVYVLSAMVSGLQFMAAVQKCDRANPSRPAYRRLIGELESLVYVRIPSTHTDTHSMPDQGSSELTSAPQRLGKADLDLADALQLLLKAFEVLWC